MAIRNAWLVIWTEEGRDQDYIVWLQKDHAIRSAADAVAGWARQELGDVEWTEDDEELKELLEGVVSDFDAKRYEDAYDKWAEYADATDARENVEVISVPIGEGPKDWVPGK